MRQTLSKSALLIAGPTASGKSALAMKLARTRNGVIINADSMQVYRELRILSARPSAEEEALVPHRLYGHVGGEEDFSVAHWLADAILAIETTWRQEKLPIVVGGTGLYFMALEKGLSEVPPIAVEIREHWRSFKGDLHAELGAFVGADANQPAHTRQEHALIETTSQHHPLVEYGRAIPFGVELLLELPSELRDAVVE